MNNKNNEIDQIQDKILGPSKYSNSKKKKQKTIIKKDPKISKQNHDLKVKIKNLQKEITRINDSNGSDVKKETLEKKLAKLIKLNKDIFKKSLKE